MNKTNFFGMQTLALKAHLFVFDTVNKISCDRMTERRHVNAYLVGTSCLECAADMGITLVPRDYAVVSNGITAVFSGKYILCERSNGFRFTPADPEDIRSITIGGQTIECGGE